MQATMNFKLDSTLKTDFLYTCQQQGISASQVIRQLITQYCASNEPTPNAETLQAMKDLLLGENTIKTTAEEFFEWAESQNVKD